MPLSRSLEANIVEACTNHKLVHSKDKNYRACVSIGADHFVKFGDPDALQPELQTRKKQKRVALQRTQSLGLESVLIERCRRLVGFLEFGLSSYSRFQAWVKFCL